MKMLALDRAVPGVADGACKPHLRAEAHRAWELYQAGVIRELYFRSDQHAAVLMLAVESLAVAQEALASLPLVAHGLIRFESFRSSPTRDSRGCSHTA